MDSNQSPDSSRDPMSRDATLSRDPIVSIHGSGQRVVESASNGQFDLMKGLPRQDSPFAQATTSSPPQPPMTSRSYAKNAEYM